MNTKLWTTKNGSKIRIKDMTDEHLVNTIRMLERKNEADKQNVPYPSFQGEMAQMYAESEFDALVDREPGDLWPIYDDMIEEAIKRKLST